MELEPVKEWKFAEIKGEWGEETAGGNLRYPSWRKNIQYQLKVKVGSRVCLRLRRTKVFFPLFYTLSL